MSKTQFDWDEAREVAGTVARSVARSYPGIDAEDIEQAVLLRVAEQQPLFKRMLYGRDALGNIFRKYAIRYANDERISTLNYSDQYHYTVGEIRALCIKALFDRDAFMATVESDPDMASRFDEIVARVVDLQTAYGKASPDDRAIIRRRFVGGETLTPAEAKASQRAVDRLTAGVNRGVSYRAGDHARRNHDGPGGRKAISNAAARAATGVNDATWWGTNAKFN